MHDGIGINGLPILAIEPDPDRYYYDNVIGGPDAFMIPADNYDTFADAILKKLITEIAAAVADAELSFANDPTAPRAGREGSGQRHKLGQLCAQAWPNP